jgi:adenosylhomocysteine nucleosidase
MAVTGMGARPAAEGARALVDAGATALASWGMAGGLDPGLTAGGIFLPNEIIGVGAAAPIATARDWCERLVTAIGAQQRISRGRLFTSPRAIGSIADKAALFKSTGAGAVDMESLSVAEVAEEHHLPFIAVRVIVDSAEDVLPRAVSAAADSHGHLHVWRLMGALALAPADLPPLIRLARRYRAANRSLANIARLVPSAFQAVSDSRRS